MSQLLLPFRRLRWQLTLTYVLITLTAALTLEVATTVADVVAPPKTPAAPPADILANAMHFTEGPQLVPYLEQAPPDAHGLAVWANLWTPEFTFSKLGFVAGISAREGSLPPVPIDVAHDVTVAILDANGKVLASASTSPVEALLANPLAQAALHKALQADKSAPQSVGTLPDGRTLAVVPVSATDNGPVLGALLVAGSLAQEPVPPGANPVQLDQIAGALKGTLPNALALVLLACIVGTFSGLLASRSITRRLSRMTQAADAWRQGELDVAVRDRAPDELGRLAQNLDSMAGQLRRLLVERQALAVAEERSRLARDLHDSVKQQLFAVTMLVGSARLDVHELPDTERTLSEAEQIARQAQQELTSLIRALRPLALVEKGLSAAVRELCDDWSQRMGVPIAVQAPADLSVPATMDQELYRVVEEALSNIARHSGATQAWVSIAEAQGSMLLRIEDSGHGFDAEQVERQSHGGSQGGTEHDGRGMGLRSMCERVEGMGGVFHIASGAQGTTVEVRVPMVPPIEPATPGPVQATLALAPPGRAET
jgi:signal transduction histidine kinase